MAKIYNIQIQVDISKFNKYQILQYLHKKNQFIITLHHQQKHHEQTKINNIKFCIKQTINLWYIGQDEQREMPQTTATNQYEIKIKSLNEDNERLNKVIASYKNMIDEQRKKIKNSDEQDLELDSIRQQNNQLKDKNRSLEIQLDRNKSDTIEIYKRFQLQKEQIKNSFQSIETNTQQMIQKIKQLEQKLKSQAKQNDQLGQELYIYKKKNIQLESIEQHNFLLSQDKILSENKISQLNDKIIILQKIVSQKKEQLSKKNQQITRLQHKIQQAQAQNYGNLSKQKMEQEIQELKRRINFYEVQLQINNSKINNLQIQFENKNNQNSGQKDFEQERKELRQELDTKQMQLSNIKNKYKDLQNKIQQIQIQRDAVQEQLNQFKIQKATSVMKQSSQLSQLKNKIKRMEQINKNYQQVIQTKEEQIQQLKNQNKILTDKIGSMSKQYQGNLNQHKLSSSKQIGSLKEKIAAFQAHETDSHANSSDNKSISSCSSTPIEKCTIQLYDQSPQNTNAFKKNKQMNNARNTSQIVDFDQQIQPGQIKSQKKVIKIELKQIINLIKIYFSHLKNHCSKYYAFNQIKIKLEQIVSL